MVGAEEHQGKVSDAAVCVREVPVSGIRCHNKKAVAEDGLPVIKCSN